MIDSTVELGDDPKRALARKKSREFGVFSLTAEDHKAMGSTPSEKLADQPNKAEYEVMSDEQIEEALNVMLDFIYDPKMIKNGVAKWQKDEFLVSLPFLKSVGRLPKIFEDFNTDNLPDIENIK